MRRIFLLLLMASVIWSCNDSSSGGGSPSVYIPEPTIDVSDADAVSTEIGTSNTSWIAKPGDPDPQTGTMTISSVSSGDTVFSTNGLSVAIPLNIETGDPDASQVLVQVDGANAHYEAPVDPDGKFGLFPRSDAPGLFPGIEAAKGSAMGSVNPQSGENLFIFKMPELIKPGQFCLTFQITNGTDISNQVSVCIEVIQRGGAGTGNLTSKTWLLNTRKWYDSDDNLILEDTMFQEVSFSFPTQIPCGGNFVNVNVEVSTRIASTMKFNIDGSFLQRTGVTARIPDSTSQCTVSYFEIDSTWVLEGGWGYSDSTKILGISINAGYNSVGQLQSPDAMGGELITNTATLLELRVTEDDELFHGDYYVFSLIPERN